MTFYLLWEISTFAYALSRNKNCTVQEHVKLLQSPSACSAAYSCQPSPLPKVDNPREYDDYRPIALSPPPVLSILLTFYFDTRPRPQSKSERMQVVYTFCSPSAKTSPETSMPLVVTVWIHYLVLPR